MDLSKRVLYKSIFLLFFIPSVAYANGGVFVKGEAKIVPTIPDQRALIHFNDGTEILVIDINFSGQGKEFAWVVPTPSIPDVEKVTSNLFVTLQSYFQPKLFQGVVRIPGIILLCLALVYLKCHVKFTELAKIGCLGLIILILGLIAIPQFGGAPGSGKPSPAIKIHESKTVGFFETVTISSQDTKALIGWLNTNGFSVPSDLAPVVEKYVSEGWVFVAVKVRRDTDADSLTRPHPLTFTFKTEKPVYPLKLTGINSKKSKVELYVYGPSRAEIPGFNVEYCKDAGHTKEIPGNRALWDRLSKATTSTKLTADLGPKDMLNDAYVSWVPYQYEGKTAFSYNAAKMLSWSIMFILMLAGFLVLYFKGRKHPISKMKVFMLHIFIILFSIAISRFIYFLLPKIEVIYI